MIRNIIFATFFNLEPLCNGLSLPNKSLEGNPIPMVSQTWGYITNAFDILELHLRGLVYRTQHQWGRVVGAVKQIN